MPINLAIVTKVKPVYLTPIKAGECKLATDQKAAMLLAGLKKNIKLIASGINDNLGEAVGTKVEGLLVLGCTTLSDNNPNDVCLIIPQGKAAQYKNAFKEIDKLAKTGNKQIATCQMEYNGKKVDDKIVLEITILSACKMKMTPVLKWLSKLGKPMGVKFEMSVGVKNKLKSNVETSAGEVSNSPLGIDEKKLERIHAKFEAAPTKVLLKAFHVALVELNNEVKQKRTKAGKVILLNWHNKFKLAKVTLKNTPIENVQEEEQEEVEDKVIGSNIEDKVIDPKEALELKFSALKEELSSLEKGEGDLLQALEMMSVCQEIRVAPQYKLVMKRNADMLKQFKQIRKAINTVILANQMIVDELKTTLINPESIKDKFQIELDALWGDFKTSTRKADSFQEILDQNMVSMEATVKKFQIGVEAQAKGMLEASKMLKIGNAAEISQNLTAIRSGIVQLKNTMSEKMKAIQNIAKQMASLEVTFHASDSEDERQKIFIEIENLTTDFSENSKTSPAF